MLACYRDLGYGPDTEPEEGKETMWRRATVEQLWHNGKQGWALFLDYEAAGKTDRSRDSQSMALLGKLCFPSPEAFANGGLHKTRTSSIREIFSLDRVISGKSGPPEGRQYGPPSAHFWRRWCRSRQRLARGEAAMFVYFSSEANSRPIEGRCCSTHTYTLVDVDACIRSDYIHRCECERGCVCEGVRVSWTVEIGRAHV